MTPRERILAAIEHRQPDKVPVDLGATPSSGFSAIAYGNLKQHLGITQGATRLYDVVQQLAQPEDFILDRFGVDVVDIGRAFNTETSAWQPTTLADGQAALYPAWFNPERPSGATSGITGSQASELLAGRRRDSRRGGETQGPWQTQAECGEVL